MTEIKSKCLCSLEELRSFETLFTFRVPICLTRLGHWATIIQALLLPLYQFALVKLSDHFTVGISIVGFGRKATIVMHLPIDKADLIWWNVDI